MNRSIKAVVTVIVETYVENPDLSSSPNAFFSTATMCKMKNFSTGNVENNFM